jgi:hypothetical protein
MIDHGEFRIKAYIGATLDTVFESHPDKDYEGEKTPIRIHAFHSREAGNDVITWQHPDFVGKFSTNVANSRCTIWAVTEQGVAIDFPNFASITIMQWYCVARNGRPNVGGSLSALTHLSHAQEAINGHLLQSVTYMMGSNLMLAQAQRMTGRRKRVNP